MNHLPCAPDKTRYFSSKHYVYFRSSWREVLHCIILYQYYFYLPFMNNSFWNYSCCILLELLAEIYILSLIVLLMCYCTLVIEKLVKVTISYSFQDSSLSVHSQIVSSGSASWQVLSWGFSNRSSTWWLVSVLSITTRPNFRISLVSARPDDCRDPNSELLEACLDFRRPQILHLCTVSSITTGGYCPDYGKIRAGIWVSINSSCGKCAHFSFHSPIHQKRAIRKEVF